MLDNKSFGQRICMLRKNKGYTQDELSRLLGITPQAISKWELGNALPDITLLPELAKWFNCSLDYLLNGVDYSRGYLSSYDSVYEQKEYYWGTEPSELAQQIVALNSDLKHRVLLDVGSGEGRDAIYFAQNGLMVDALEISVPGIEKIRKGSQNSGYDITPIQADMLNYKMTKNYDIIYSCGSLQFVTPKQRPDIFSEYKKCTCEHGLNAHLVFIDKPFVKPAPDWQANEYFYKSGELLYCYDDWEILHYAEETINCNSMNIPHQHAVCTIIAKKP